MIDIEKLSFKYKDSLYLNIDNISLNIKRGECILLAGPSGSGKTTLLRLINGLIPHFYEGSIEGKVFINKQSIADMEMYNISKKVATVYQNPRSQFFNIDTNSEIAFGIENLAVNRENLLKRMNKAVSDTEVESLLNKSLFELSRGQQQRIAFASVYAMGPDIYLLDEPSSNLDLNQTERLKNLIIRLKNMNKTIIISEHRIYYLRKLVDRVIYMNNGEILIDQTSVQFFNQADEDRIKLGLRSFYYLEPRVNYKLNNENNNILKCLNISCGYKKKIVLENINLYANYGDIIGICGENGIGKTTLLKSVAGLSKLMSGKITYNNKVVNQKERVKLCYMVFQDVDYQLFGDSVENECSYGLRNVDETKIQDILDLLNLSKYKDFHPSTLSGGQKQRLAIAVSMVLNKDILIFDEPTSGLDLESMRKVSTLIKQLSKMSKIIFIITHDFEFLNYCCNRVISIDGHVNKKSSR